MPELEKFIETANTIQEMLTKKKDELEKKQEELQTLIDEVKNTKGKSEKYIKMKQAELDAKKQKFIEDKEKELKDLTDKVTGMIQEKTAEIAKNFATRVINLLKAMI